MAIENVALSDWLFEVGGLSPGHLAEGPKMNLPAASSRVSEENLCYKRTSPYPVAR